MFIIIIIIGATFTLYTVNFAIDCRIFLICGNHLINVPFLSDCQEGLCVCVYVCMWEGMWIILDPQDMTKVGFILMNEVFIDSS